ncbi:MAG: YdcF family protein [Alphaproteobacteria bacterium]|nr:YdcF family protein [Alphaproteobacteria bacterium]
MKKILWFIYTFFLIAVFFWLSGFIVFCHYINNFQTSDEASEAVAVLTGGRHRIAEGINLLNNKIGAKLFISGVAKKTTLGEIERKAGNRVQNKQLVELGYEATDTISNASEIAEWVKKNNIHSLRLVTSNYHLPRAIEELAVYKLPVSMIAHPVYSEKVAVKWWSSFATFRLLAEEYNKFIYTAVKHRFYQISGD